MRHLILALSLLFALPLSLPARASDVTWPDLSTPPSASAGDGSKDAALVIGIEDYAFAQDIPGARANAGAWRRWLKEARGVPTVKLLVDQQASREEILRWAGAVAGKVKPGGRLWVVWIGHGAPARGGDDGVLVGVDAQQTAASIEDRGLTRQELLDALAVGPQSETVLVLDACFSGKTSGGDLAPGLAPLNPVSARVKDTKVTVLTAARSDEYAGPLSDGRRPAFSYLVLGALRGWGDRDRDGIITATEAVAYADGALFDTVTGRTQTPELSGRDLPLGRGREDGPDLGALGMATPSSLSTGLISVSSSGGEGLTGADIQALVAAKARRQVAEAQEAALLAKLSAERDHQLSAAVADQQAQARALWAQMAPLLDGGGPEAVQAVESFVAAWSDAQVVVEDVEGRHPRAVPITELAQAKQWLGQARIVAAPAAAGSSRYEMVRIPAGSFVMGSPGSEQGRDDDETRHTVRIRRSFLLGKTEVTQGQWEEVMGDNPARFDGCGSECPVERVSWVDAARFANKLSQAEGLEPCYGISGDEVSWPKGLTCTGYRLPTESEWEYAARAGTDRRYAGGDELDAVGWTVSNAGGKTHRVATKAANAWGLHDMTGNVWEWIWDLYGAYPTGAVTDPTGASTGSSRVDRGGSWDNYPRDARLADRDGLAPGNRRSILGLRLARSLP